MKKLLKISLTLIFTIILLLGFAMPLNPNGFWYQQFMPNLNGASISDITFVDSLNGFATTLYRTGNDSAFILNTTNGGDNWSFNISNNFPFYKVQFINRDTGYALSFQKLFKTTNRGINWQVINVPLSTAFVDFYVLSLDTIWGAASESFSGGVFFTSNGGVNWQNQFSSGNQNPNKIYMYNARIGFMSNSSALPNIYKTTNGGMNWILNLPGENFTDMHFSDSLTGWKCMPGFIAGDSCIKKTTNGGSNWFKQTLPAGGIINLSQIVKFSFLNKDTIYGVGGQVNYGGSRYRGIIYKTINGGNNWLFQVPDTSFGIAGFASVQFINKNNGWAYFNATGIHTTNGGDTTFLVGLQQLSSEVPKEFMLFQNYPNPFNPKTNIKYQITNNNSFVQLTVYDITGREIVVLVNQKQNSGTYEVDFAGIGYSSGVYFYRLSVKGQIIDTKKMMLVK